MSVLIVGSVALDSVKTPTEEKQNLLGGAASYASVAASFFSPVNFVGIVGEDFPKEHLEFLSSRPIDLQGLQIVKGETFRWAGEYFSDMNQRQTHSTELNVFQDFMPTLPEAYRSSPIVLLGNIAPSLQIHVLNQVESPRFVIADTMNLWIETTRRDLLELLKRIDMLILNESEARLLTGENNLILAGRLIRELGPQFVVVNKGEHGSLLFGENGSFFSCPAYPLEKIMDPTGAGDCFAGGFAGYLASTFAATEGKCPINFQELRPAVVYGTLLASFNVQAFSIERLRALTLADIDNRYREFQSMSQCEPTSVMAAKTPAPLMVPPSKTQATIFI